MSTRDTEIENAARALKKILALRKTGGWGHFYFVGTPNGKEAALSITLASKDPKGLKAASIGKKLRREISDGKFSTGTVRIAEKSFLFEIISGNAGVSIIKAGFKTTLSKEKGLDLLKTRSVIKMATKEDEVTSAPPQDDLVAVAAPPLSAAMDDMNNVPPPTSATGVDDDDSDFLELENLLANVDLSNDDLEDLKSEMPILSEMVTDLTGLLGDPIPSDEELIAQEEARLAELIQKRTDKCAKIAGKLERRKKKLENVSPQEHEALQAEIAQLEGYLQNERYKLASDLYVGDNPFPPPVGELSPEMKEIIGATVNEAIALKRTRLENIHKEIQDIAKNVEKNNGNEEWLQENKQSIAQNLMLQETAITNFMSEIQQLTK